MTVNELVATGDFKALIVSDGDRVINGGYIGDLLSWVMGRAQADNAWITIMTNINVVAVAALADVACIVLAEGVVPDKTVIETAESKGINIISTEKSAFESAVILGGLI